MATTVLYVNVTDIKLCAVDQKEDSYKEFYEIAQTVTGLVIYPLACIPGFLGNMLTIFVLSRRNMLTSTNAFLSALAVSDSIKLVNDIMYIMVTVFLHIDKELGRIAYGYLYPYAHFIFSMSVCVSSWLTVSVAIERYILVCHPTRARAFWNRKRAVWLCVTIYVIMTILALPSALRYRTINCVDRKTNVTRLEVELTEIWKNQLLATAAYEWIQNLLRSIIPLLILVVLNVCIICALNRTKANRGRNPRHRVTIMMIVVILVFLICITPDAILSTVFEFGYHEEGYLEKGIREITDSLLTINAAVNFIIYCVFNQVFRKSFARLCCPTNRPVGWITELDESTYRRLSEAKYLLSTNNNSPPRRNTPPKAKSGKYHRENQIALNSGVVSNVSLKNPEDHNCSLNTAAWQDLSRQSSPLITSSSSSSSENCNSRTTQINQQLAQHQYRASSGGLKKSRNSVKSSRAKNIAKVTFLENDEFMEDFTGDGSEPFQQEGMQPNPQSRVHQVRQHGSLTDLSCRVSELEEVLPCNDSDCRTKRHTERKIDSGTRDTDDVFNFRVCDGLRTASKVRFKDYLNGSTDTFKIQPVVEKEQHDATDSRDRGIQGQTLKQLYPDSNSESLVSRTVKSQDIKSDFQVLTDSLYPDSRTMVSMKGDNIILTVQSPDSVVYDDFDYFPSSYFCDQILTTDV